MIKGKITAFVENLASTANQSVSEICRTFEELEDDDEQRELLILTERDFLIQLVTVWSRILHRQLQSTTEVLEKCQAENLKYRNEIKRLTYELKFYQRISRYEDESKSLHRNRSQNVILGKQRNKKLIRSNSLSHAFAKISSNLERQKSSEPGKLGIGALANPILTSDLVNRSFQPA